MLNDRSTPLTYLKTRRSGRPRNLIAPGPSSEELRDILSIAARTPDHGKLAPWRFLHVRMEDRPALESLLLSAHKAQNPDQTAAEVEAVQRFANQAPTLIVALFSPVEGTKIPIWEQELSCGAACMNLLHGAQALGYAAGWVTGWAAYSDAVRQAFAQGKERIAGFIFIGTPSDPLEERPRPALKDVASDWRPIS